MVWLRRTAAAAVAAVALLPAACTTADDELGYDFVPDDQKMTMRRKVVEQTESGRRLLTTKLFRTDSIISSNISYGYMGLQKDADFGTREAGFFTQYMVIGTSDSTGFGYRPIFDSIQLLLSVKDFSGDSTERQRFNVYEVTDYFFDANTHQTTDAEGNTTTVTDSTFYLTFDPADFHGRRYISQEPAFTFDFPGNGMGPSTTAVKMNPTQTGMALIRKWMLEEGDYAGNDMSVYKNDSLWTSCFKGFYITPARTADGSPESPVEQGAMFALDLENSGFTIYGRNRHEEDPELVRDTTQALYYFYYAKALHGNQSVNSVRRDYSETPELSSAVMDEAEAERPEVTTCYVEGMGGPVTEIHFTDDFFGMMESLLNDSDDDGNATLYNNMAINQVKMLIYLREADYDWERTEPDVLTPALDASMSRLGLYTNFKTLTAVADYNYIYETQYSMDINYGGYLSRSLGCYELDITAYVQSLWNRYRALEDKSDLSTIVNRTVYLAPEAYGVYGFRHAIVQGVGDGASAPIKLELTYTLIK